MRRSIVGDCTPCYHAHRSSPSQLYKSIFVEDANKLMSAVFRGLFLLIILGILTSGCGASGASGRTIDIADIGWTENTAIAHLTKVLLEEQRGLLESVQDSVEQLSFSYEGETEQGIAVPYYMDATSLDQLNQSDAYLILGIEPGSVVMGVIYDEVIPAYDLPQKLVEGPTQGMLEEVDKRYRGREEFALVAWSPHWMNQRFDLRYLEDLEDALGELNDPAKITAIVNEDLPENDPVATAFMDALIFDEEQIGDLESAINEAEDPYEGARRWAEDNPEVWQPWVEAAQDAQQ